MKKLFFFLTILMAVTGFSQDALNTISGTITNGDEPLANVNIKILGTSTGTKTDALGKYSITASVGETLEYSYVGYVSIQVIVEDVTSELNVEMQKIAQELDEVVVKKNIRKTQKELALEYDRNKNIVWTKFGYLDRDRAAYTIRTYDGDEIPRGAFTLLESLRLIYPQLRITDNGVFIRARSSFNDSQGVIFDLDGQTLLEPPLLNMDEIERVAIIPSASYSVRYGSVAAEGVIVINTKTGRIKPKTDAVEVKDLQAAHESFITDNFCNPSTAIPQPYQLKNLVAAETEGEAIAIYNQEKEFFEKAPYVLLDAGAYFNKQWDNKEKAKAIWDEVKVKYDDNANILKAVAYHFEQQGDFKAALDIYQRISALRPEYAQTYRDLANMHHKLDNPKQALKLYTSYLEKEKDSKKEMDVEGISFIMNVEALNVLSKNKMKISKEFKNYELPFDDAANRIVLEWNNGETEFDVEMIHDDKSYVTWNHSNATNASEIREEKVLGYSTKQFFVNKNDMGKWVFNVNYLGNKSANPSYLKATVQYDYGTKAQREVVKVVRLPEQKSCLRLLSI